MPHSPQLAVETKRAVRSDATIGCRSRERDDVELLIAARSDAVRDLADLVGIGDHALGDAESDRELEVVARACAS